MATSLGVAGQLSSAPIQPSPAQDSFPNKKKVLAIGDVHTGYQHDSVSHALATIERLGRQSGDFITYIRTDTQLITKGDIYGTEGYMIFPDYSSYYTFLGPKREPGPSASVAGSPMMDLDQFQNWVKNRSLKWDAPIVDAPPGRGPSLHKHPYAKILIVQDGEGTFIVGDEQREAGPGEVLIVPPDTPHAFTNTGRAPLRQIDIHLSRSFQTEWL